jgi:hypothetical protein
VTEPLAAAEVKNSYIMDASKEAGLEINLEKTKYMLLSRHKNVGQNQDT